VKTLILQEVTIDVSRWTNASTTEFWNMVAQIFIYLIMVVLAVLTALSFSRGAISTFHYLTSAMDPNKRKAAGIGILRAVVSTAILGAAIPLYLMMVSPFIGNSAKESGSLWTTSEEVMVEDTNEAQGKESELIIQKEMQIYQDKTFDSPSDIESRNEL